MKDFFYINRNILDHCIFKNSDYVRAFIDLICLSNKDLEIEFDLSRYEKLLGHKWKIKSVKQFFKKLESHNLIKVEYLKTVVKVKILESDLIKVK